MLNLQLVIVETRIISKIIWLSFLNTLYLILLTNKRGMPELLTETEIMKLAQDRKRWDSILKTPPNADYHPNKKKKKNNT
jgi:hypothetical protein